MFCRTLISHRLVVVESGAAVALDAEDAHTERVVVAIKSAAAPLAVVSPGGSVLKKTRTLSKLVASENFTRRCCRELSRETAVCVAMLRNQ